MTKEYWDGPYYDYLLARAKEANNLKISDSELVKNDIKIPSDKTYKLFVEKMKLQKNSRLLDLGCGFGRTFKYFFEKGVFVTGVDISQKMIKEAEKSYKKNNLIENLIVSKAEKLPLNDNEFDYLTSFGTFDCINQKLGLSEMLRVVKPGGLLCFSGKNYCYKFDDLKAYSAEIGAMKKGHPNSFTYYEKMKQILIKNGNKVTNELFFINRGDTTNLKIKYKNPGQFYEYTIYVIKGENVGIIREIHSPTSYVYDSFNE